jgi:hypothetical protein
MKPERPTPRLRVLWHFPEPISTRGASSDNLARQSVSMQIVANFVERRAYMCDEARESTDTGR